VLQNALDLHNIEQPTPITGSDMDAAITTLDERGYIDKLRIAVQTPGAVFALDSAGNVTLNISGVTNANVRTLYSQLSELEQRYVSGG
jgi:hypothetical protein